MLTAMPYYARGFVAVARLYAGKERPDAVGTGGALEASLAEPAARFKEMYGDCPFDSDWLVSEF